MRRISPHSAASVALAAFRRIRIMQLSNHGVGAVVLAAARGRAAAAARALGGGSGSATRSCVAAEGARRLSRPLACLARAAAPPGGVADLGGCPKQRGIQGPDARSTIAVESKIGVDLGGFFVVL